MLTRPDRGDQFRSRGSIPFVYVASDLQPAGDNPRTSAGTREIEGLSVSPGGGTVPARQRRYRIRVVTDAGADLPASLAEALGIRIVHGAVHFGTELWQGSEQEFWEAVRRGGPAPSTSPPTAAALAEAFSGAEFVCSIHVSAELSRTVEHAKEAAAGAESVHVVDTRSLSVGTGLVAVAAAEAAELNTGFHQVKALVRRLVDQAHVYAVIEDVSFLIRGGRAGLIGASAKPGSRQVLAVRGHAIPLGHARDRPGAIRELLHHVAGHGGHSVDRWAVGHGDADDAEDFVGRARRQLGRAPSFVVPLGPAVGTHAGPGALILGVLEAG